MKMTHTAPGYFRPLLLAMTLAATTTSVLAAVPCAGTAELARDPSPACFARGCAPEAGAAGWGVAGSGAPADDTRRPEHTHRTLLRSPATS